MNGITRRATIVTALVVFAANAAGQGRIALRSGARIADGRAILVADIAVLEGPDAAPLGGVVVVRADERSGAGHDEPIGADRVRQAVDAWAGPRGVNWGRLTISGVSCTILPASEERPATVPTPAPAGPPGPTVRAVVEERMRQLFGVGAQDLRLSFDDADREILSFATSDRTVDVRPTGSSERMPLAIAVFDGPTSRLLASRTIRVGVQIRRDVAVARSAKQRGDLLAESDVAAESRWVGPDADWPPAERVIGSSARTRLTPGRAIAAGDIEPPIVVRKGELVSVHSVNGLVIVRLTARALGQARQGETVRLQSLTDDGRTFYGRMDGRGRAAAVSPEPLEDKP